MHEQMKKIKAELELKRAREMKDNKKGFCKYSESKRKAKEITGTLPSQAADLIGKD